MGTVHPRREVEWTRYHLTTKRGPAGGHALLWAVMDFFSLPRELEESLRFVGGRKLRATFDFLSGNRDFCR